MNKNFCLGFFGTLILCALIAWLGGYNFDARGPGLAYGTGVSFWIAVMVGAVAASVSA
jgi:hypothetical protein